MKLRTLLASVFLVVAIIVIWKVSEGLDSHYHEDRLDEIHDSAEIVLFVLSGCTVLLALLTYWSSVQGERKKQLLEQRVYLEEFYRRFIAECEVGIEALDWPTILRKRYIPLCRKALAYRDALEQGIYLKPLRKKDRKQLRNLDKLFDSLEHLQLAIKHNTVDIKSAVLYFEYFVDLAQEACEQNKALRKYVKECWSETVLVLFENVNRCNERSTVWPFLTR